MQVIHDALTFDVVDAGPTDGEVVVLLHGFPQDSSAWDQVAQTLAAAGFRTLAPDQRGYSPGARPTGAGAYTVRRLVDDLWAVLDAAGVDQAHVVGHDWGAAVAWGAAADRPDRLRSLTALSVPHPAAMRAGLLRGQALRSSYIGLLLVPGLAERLLRPGSPRWQWLTHDLPAHKADGYRRRMSEPDAFTAALNWYRALPRHLVRPEVRIGSIHVPTLFVWGADDSTVSRAAAEHTRTCVDAPYTGTTLPGAGHWLPETQASQVSALLLPHLRKNS
jgi:pimeloyl-ACP methyl ester carboxylesterase